MQDQTHTYTDTSVPSRFPSSMELMYKWEEEWTTCIPWTNYRSSDLLWGCIFGFPAAAPVASHTCRSPPLHPWEMATHPWTYRVVMDLS